MRAEVVIMAIAGCRAAVDEGMVPRIHRRLLALQIRSIPLRDIRRTLDQRLQTLFSRWITPNVQLVEIEYRCKAFNGLVGNRDACATKLAQRSRRDQADQQPENDHDDKNLKKGKSFITSFPFSTQKHHKLTHGKPTLSI